MNKDNKSLWALFAMFLFGIILGFVFAPVKKGVNVRVANNGNVYKDDGYFELDDEDFDNCDDYDDCDYDDCEDCTKF